MLTEVQKIIQRIADTLKDNENFNIEIVDEGVAIQVYSRSGQSTCYHGYELYLMEEVVKSLGSTLEYKIITDNGEEIFVVTTDANFNLQSYINSTNLKLRSFSTDTVNTVFIGEKLTDDSRGEFSILTGYTNGTWTRCDITKSELLYAAVNDLSIEPNESGIFWYPVLINMNGVFFDELSEVANG
ncbi:hypothetical protein [Yersinia phage fHe-Yen9-04]|uniref:Uncharacterized protein n=2 Tax=Eneladusvirus Yen904 TaxID=2560849 RepID=A0A2C9CXU5_9CAUD|nr:hypothetical protein FDJ41_gp523 [Yersinia phage fHe-Yen9-04]SOK58657.1 hypothetical protein [Yersinia phage fHe-Yen9-04]SOK59193.1 hypothetical protein [Yersinia phage fHe-Yen9-03]VUE36426.1 hypothetical protein [Yersinia phage fHe-Yen9-04]